MLSSPLETKFLTSRRLLGAGCNHKQSKLLLTTCRIAGALISYRLLFEVLSSNGERGGLWPRIIDF